MKKIICSTVIALVALTSFAQYLPPQHEWNATIKVVDEDGSPVVDAHARVGYFGSGSESIDGLTDTNGFFTASHAARGGLLSFTAEKPGYYRTWAERDLGFQYNPTAWNFTQTLVLKKIVNPIALFARKAQIEIPVVDKPIGFDLLKYDWVAPYGRGEQSDIIFEAHKRWVSRHDFDSTLKITFPDSGDGLLAVFNSSTQGSSEPLIPAKAPLEGYTPELQRELSNTPTGGWKNDSQNQNYYLRIRTVLDENGNVKSALYGKIYGDFTLDPINSKTALVLFTYYLNPTPNDRNVEFDPNRNLFRNLPAMQQVKEP